MSFPLRQFLEAVEEHEDADSSSDGSSDVADGDNPISLLDAFGIYSSRAPSPGVPRPKRMAEEIIDDDAMGSIFLPVWDRYQDVCMVFWHARASRTTRSTSEEPQGAAPPTAHLPALEVQASPNSMLPPKVPPSPSKPTRGVRKHPYEHNGPLVPFRSSGWAQTPTTLLPSSSSRSSPTFVRDNPSAALHHSAGPSRSQWDDYATSSSGFSSGRSRW
ncbi:hypothetical protein BD309DRAFT_995389 [Dichomitus squalens]|uniref:Uncharacterized protein n=1 Tax=Dichomitus squalens TaxID=114155 RepID=A0A4Q9N9J4_9APHY|nr:hypothetical protein BD309DRAFT_995389 [Dichomitus squalens]TBU51186.1 hypothetical protein BD310DRAFT_953382 [Dichomitus squalens]